MTDLSDKVRRALEFDHLAAVNNSLKWDALNRGGYELFKDGAGYERARTSRLDAALVAAVSALECIEAHEYGKADLFDTAKNTICEALRAIREAVECE